MNEKLATTCALFRERWKSPIIQYITNAGSSDGSSCCSTSSCTGAPIRRQSTCMMATGSYILVLITIKHGMNREHGHPRVFSRSASHLNILRTIQGPVNEHLQNTHSEYFFNLIIRGLLLFKRNICLKAMDECTQHLHGVHQPPGLEPGDIAKAR